MGSRFNNGGSLPVLILTVSIVAIIAATLCFAWFFIQPGIDVKLLYRLSHLAMRTALAGIAVSFAVAVGLQFLARHVEAAARLHSLAVDRRRRWAKAGGILLTILLISCFVPDFGSVAIFRGGGWFSTGWSGMHAISELVARQYLWGAIRLWSVFLLAAAVNISAIPLTAWGRISAG